MPDPVTHANLSMPIAGGALASAVGVVFGLDLIAICCALLGAFFGLAFRPACQNGLSRFALAMRFAVNAAYVAGTAIVTAFLVTWVIHYIKTPIYPLAFFCGMALMVFREKILEGAGMLVTALFSRATKWVGGE